MKLGKGVVFSGEGIAGTATTYKLKFWKLAKVHMRSSGSNIQTFKFKQACNFGY